MWLNWSERTNNNVVNYSSLRLIEGQSSIKGTTYTNNLIMNIYFAKTENTQFSQNRRLHLGPPDVASR